VPELNQTTVASHSPSSRPPDAFAIAVTIGLCLSWGFNNVAIKLAIHDIPPLIQSSVRSVIAAMLVGAWTQARGIKLFERDGTLKAGILAGVLFALEFVLIYRGLLWTTVTRATLFLYLAPFFVVIGSRWLVPGDRFNLLQWLGLLLSFAGIAIAFGLPTPAVDPRQMLGDVMLVGAAAAWAATTLTIKATALNRVSAEKTLLYQLVVSAPLLAIGAIVLREHVEALPSPLALGRFRLSDHLGRELHIRGLVRAHRALFGRAAVGVHLPGPALRRGGRPSSAGRSADRAICARGRGGRRRHPPRQLAAVTLYAWLRQPIGFGGRP
jgi:drug/metabolite transporter (DMT)-like permease